MSKVAPFRGIVPAMSVPWHPDDSLDEAELRRFTRWLTGHEGIGALATNGHTGEVYALSPKERAHVTRIVAEAAGDTPVISGICCEGINEAVEHAGMAVEAGASGCLIMPPHGWLRFGMRPEHVVDHFTAIGKAVDANLVVHVYPAWTRASYTSELLAELARLPWVTTFKLGTREVGKYERDIKAIRAADPDVTILDCIDEFLLATMIQGVDGALVGFASFVPELIIELYAAVQANDLVRAKAVYERIFPLKEMVYGTGEPSGDAHARMKMAMVLSGRFKSARNRPPIREPEGPTLEHIRRTLEQAGMLLNDAA